MDRKEPLCRGEEFRKFVFRSTGDATEIPLSPNDLYDNLSGELDRLKALYWLLRASKDELDTEVVAGVGELLRDVHDRMKTALELAK
jgi:hypothetical protein